MVLNLSNEVFTKTSKKYKRVHGESIDWFCQLNRLSKARHLSYLAFKNKKKTLEIKNENGIYEK